MQAKLTVLGSSAAVPSNNRHLSAHLLEMHGHSMLFDCGEATQFQLLKFKKNINRIEYIFITHLHGDHFYGLVGLLSTMNMKNRNRSLIVFGPKGLQEAVEVSFGVSKMELTFPLSIHIIEPEGCRLIVDDDDFKVFAFPLKHSIPTYGYLLKAKKAMRNIKKEFVNSHLHIENTWFARIKAGEDYVNSKGEVISNDEITISPKIPPSYAYCSDTAFLPQLASWVSEVGLLYHESTYLHQDDDKAALRLHSTAKQAAQIAKMAKAKQLLLGHFSGRYKDVSPFEEQAAEVFDNVILAQDGMEIMID